MGLLDRVKKWRLWHPGRSEAARTVQDAQVTLVFITLFGLVGITVFASQFPPTEVVSVLGVGWITAGAASLFGGLIGFIFGLPHSGQPTPHTDGQTPDSSEKSPYPPNTNLDQVSDWLTKLIVGAGLVQLGRAPDALGRLGSSLGPGFGDLGNGASADAAVAVVLYFTVCGFLQGFVWARLTLPRALRDSDLDTAGNRVATTSSGPRPEVSVTPANLLFGDVTINSFVELSLTVTNTGNDALVIHAVTLGGVNLEAFSFDEPILRDRPVPPNSAATVKVIYSPTDKGPSTATVNFSDNTLEGVHQAVVSGRGVAA